jgi:hypothetical protein
MKVGRPVVIEIHRDREPEEAAYCRHRANIGRQSGRQARSEVAHCQGSALGEVRRVDLSFVHPRFVASVCPCSAFLVAAVSVARIELEVCRGGQGSRVGGSGVWPCGARS